MAKGCMSLVKTLHEKGKSLDEISAATGRSASTVRHVLYYKLQIGKRVIRAEKWTASQITLLTNLWTETDLTAKEIGADHLGGMTKNAVIGKAGRLGLVPRKTGVKRQKSSLFKPRSVSKDKSKPSPKPVKLPVLAKDAHKNTAGTPTPSAQSRIIHGGVNILGLEPHHCKAVIGYGEDELARYCGEPRSVRPKMMFERNLVYGPDGNPQYEQTPYCAAHAKENYRAKWESDEF